jgi:hypothetical protein
MRDVSRNFSKDIARCPQTRPMQATAGHALQKNFWRALSRQSLFPQVVNSKLVSRYSWGRSSRRLAE